MSLSNSLAEYVAACGRVLQTTPGRAEQPAAERRQSGFWAWNRRICPDRFEKEFKCRSTLSGARWQWESKAVPTIAARLHFESLALRADRSRQIDGLFGNVVGRLKWGCRNKPDVTFAVVAKTPGKIRRFACCGHITGGLPEKIVSRLFAAAFESPRSHVVSENESNS